MATEKERISKLAEIYARQKEAMKEAKRMEQEKIKEWEKQKMDVEKTL